MLSIENRKIIVDIFDDEWDLGRPATLISPDYILCLRRLRGKGSEKNDSRTEPSGSWKSALIFLSIAFDTV